MANVKVTKRERFNQILAIADVQANEELVDFINHEIELLDKKRTGKKQTKTQEANEKIKALIVNTLNGNDPMTVTELLGTGVFEAGTSNQKISALLRQLVNDEVVVKTIDKKVSRFAVA